MKIQHLPGILPLLCLLLLLAACTPGELQSLSLSIPATPTPFGSLLEETPEVEPVMSVTSLSANLYTGPARYYESAGTTLPGQEVGVIGRNESGDWYQLTDGRWVPALAVRGRADVPVVTEIPGRIVAQVVDVLDGDTLQVTYDDRTYEVRYLLSNAPQVDQALGREAYEKNLELAEGQTVLLETGEADMDAYRRLLRYVYRAEDEVMLNEEMVRSGYAQVVAFAPNSKYEERLRAAQAEAQEARRGLWAAETVALREDERGCVYTVQPGETLFTIAKRFGITTESLGEANEVEDINFVRDGTELLLPDCVTPVQAEDN